MNGLETEKKEQNRIKIKMDGRAFEIPAGTCYGDFLNNRKAENGLDILLVLADGKLQELHKVPEHDCTIVPITALDKAGMDTYKRSLNFLFLTAASDVLAGRSAALRFSNGNGYYYSIDSEEKPAVLAGKIRARMETLVKAALPLEKRTVSTSYARSFFASARMRDKERLFRYRRVSSVNLYSLENFRDYFYGYMVWNTGFLRYFDVTAYEDGVVLVLPDPENPTHVSPFSPFPKIFRIQKQSEDWAQKLGINAIGDLNDLITGGQIGHELLVAEALQESNIASIAQQISDRKTIRFVMIAGPSSSGKTTFSRRLSIQLSAHGMAPHPISLDNFYLDRRYCPRDENGEIDFESLDALDVPLIRRTMENLLAGEETELPHFNFLTGEREYHGDRIRLGQGDILVIEGIHGLNQKLVEHLPAESVFRVYISALTQLNVDEHNHISTTDGRLIRRIVRDYRTRGTDARETIERWPSVRRGEQNYIFPNQENADVMFNSALIYELAVLKTYAEPLLFQVPEDAPEFLEANRLLKFLDYILAVPSEAVPTNSILREFIGGSCFSL